MPKPERCGKCGAEPQKRKRCPRCGEAEWVLQHGAHYIQGAREVISCDCPAPHSALGKRMEQAREQQERELTGKRPAGRPGRDHPVTTPEMAKKAAEGLARGLGPTVALREAGFPEWTANRGKRGINRMIRAEFGKLGRKYIKMGKELSPEDQESIVRGRLLENIIIGTDKGVLSAKQLGADKRISMWNPDSQVGMVILSPPPMAKIDHDVPIIESRAMRERAAELSRMKERRAMLAARSEHEQEPEEATPAERDLTESHDATDPSETAGRPRG